MTSKDLLLLGIAEATIDETTNLRELVALWQACARIEADKRQAIERYRRIRERFARIVAHVEAYATRAEAEELEAAENGLRKLGIDPEAVR